MARTRVIYNSLNAGEWSPLLEGRSDLAKYVSAARSLKNMLPLKFGGAKRRPGTRFVAEVKTSSKATALIPFEFSKSQAYIIEVGDLYMRFYKEGGRIESPPGTAVEIASTYLEADLFKITYAQSADVLYLACAGYAPRKLTRTSDTAWTITAMDFLDGPYLAERTDITITPSGTSGSVTLTASAAVFLAGHVDSVWRLKHGTTWTWFKITAFTNTTTVTATVRSTATTAAASAAFREGAWSAVRGFPETVSLYEQRSWWGNTTNDPDTLWGSQTGSYENFSPGTALANEGVEFTLSSRKLNAIEWLAGQRALIAGTAGQEHFLSGGSPDEPITPANPNAKAPTKYGSAAVAPVEAANAILFVQRAGRKLREILIDPSADAYTGPFTDLSLMAEHITTGGIDQLAYQQELDSIVWAIRGGGALLSLTYDRPQDVVAWARHFTGTAQDASDGKFESVAVIPHPDQDQDQAWVIVKRTIGGGTKRYVEYLDTKGGHYGALNVDSGLVYSGAATATLSGLSHLNGQTVDIVGNGAVYPQQVVSGGAVTGLSPTVTQAEVGLHYDSEIETMRPEAGAITGTAQGAPKRWSEIFVRLNASLGVKIGADTLAFRKASDPMDSAPPIFTGDKRITQMGWNRDGTITVRQEQPLPLHVLSIFGVLDVGE